MQVKYSFLVVKVSKVITLYYLYGDTKFLENDFSNDLFMAWKDLQSRWSF